MAARPDTTDDSAGDPRVVPDLVRKAPGPIRWVLQQTYCPLLSADDTPRERLLKTFVFTSLGLQIPPWFNLALAVGTAATSDSGFTPAAITEAAVMAVNAISYVLTYVYARWTRRASEWSADLVNLQTYIAITTMAITDTDAPMAMIAVYGAYFMLIALTPRSLLFGVLYALTFFVGGYNYIVADSNRGAIASASDGTNEWGLPLLAIPGVFDRGMAIRFVWLANLFMPGTIIAIGVGLRMASADELSRRADATAKLAATISHALTRYDTATAAAALDSAASDGVVDEAMLGHFATLIANLDEYRPHLPNWVVAKTTAMSDGDDGSLSSEPDGVGRLDHSRSDRGSATRPSRRRESETDELERSGRRAPSTNSRTSSASAQLRPARGSTHKPSFHDGAQLSITSVVASVVAADITVVREQPLAAVQAACDAAVDRTHELARRTYGAVHSFVGDRLIVSWNAASRVANPQAKSARFLLQLAASATDGQLGAGTTVTGAACSGPAYAHVAGLASQRALVVVPRGHWRDALDALRAEAAARGTLLCDERTRREAEHAVVLRATAAVVLPEIVRKKPPPVVVAPPGTAEANDGTNEGSNTTPEAKEMSPATPAIADDTPREVRVAGYALVALCDDGGEEWMYVLKNREAREAEAARVAQLQRWAAGESNDHGLDV